MKFKKWTSLLLVFTLLFAMSLTYHQGVFADTVPYSGIDVSTGHSFPVGVIIGPDGKLYISEYSANKITRVDKDGQNKITFATGFSQPIGMAFDNAGNLYVAEHNGSKVTKVDSGGTTSLVKSIGGGYLTGLVIDSNNKIFVLDYTGGKIYKMDLDGSNYSTFVTGLPISSNIGLAIDASDNLYFTDRTNSKVIKVAPNAAMTDFVTGITNATSLALGKDGYFYVSSGIRTIEQVDTAGTKLRTFSTGTISPWGLAVDLDGYIYFGETSTTVRKIVGSAETQNTSSLKITLNKEINAGSADPAAFTISGAASNPTVTSAVISGSSVILTLNANMTTLDTSLKVNYAKTGTNNLVVSGGSNEFNNFSNLTVKNSILRVLSVATISQINVANGTSLSAVSLPSTVTLNLSNSTTSGSAVTWDGGTPVYNGDTAGTYAFSGTVGLSENVSNPNNVKAAVNVVVGAAPAVPNIDSVASIADINVANGTGLVMVGLPTAATVTLSNSTTSSAAITWDAGTPAYNSTTAGTYVFSGTLALNGGFLNPGNLKAAANVIVGAATLPSEETEKDPIIQSPAPVQPPKDNTIIIVNGETQRIGQENLTSANGVTKVEVSVISGSMEKIIEAILKDAAAKPNPAPNVVEINVVDTSANLTVIGLTGEIVKMLDQNNFDVLIKKGTTTYSIPAKELTVDAVAQKLSISQDQLKSIKFEIQMQQLTVEQQKSLNDKVKANNSEIMIQPIEFKIIAKVEKTDGTSATVTISTFTQFVERIFEIPNNININDITTGIVFNEDQTYNHVPTNIFMKDGKYYARINSLTNSTYSVIKNPIKVASVKGHWSEMAVNDMASRLVLANIQNFNADANITRGELAEYLVRALGLYRAEHPVALKFNDVNAKDQNAVAISIASQWGLIAGYTDGTFKANAELTREEAMVMYVKAMAIAQYVSDPANVNNADASGASSWAKSFVKRALDSKVFVGRSGGALELKEHLTHAEALTAIKNILTNSDLINKN